MRIIVLGATGMLGYEVFRICLQRKIDVHGIVRNKHKIIERLGTEAGEYLHVIEDIKNIDAVEKIIADVKPACIINCIGIVKQSSLSEDYYESVAINSFFPHQLAKLCGIYHCQLFI